MGKFLNYPHQYYLNKNTEGIAFLSKSKPTNVEMFHNNLSSTIAAGYDRFNLINVYRFSKSGQIKNFTEQFLKDISSYMNTNIIICGDLNLDLIDNTDNIFTKNNFFT